MGQASCANGPAGSPSHNQPETVEIYFSSDAGKADAGALALDLLAPKFDLPLENLTWRVFLNDKWRVEKWRGAMQLQQQEIVADGGTLNLQGYLQSESMLQQQKTQEAEQMLALEIPRCKTATRSRRGRPLSPPPACPSMTRRSTRTRGFSSTSSSCNRHWWD